MRGSILMPRSPAQSGDGQVWIERSATDCQIPYEGVTCFVSVTTGAAILFQKTI
ncbi:MAG: hypothetical protein ACREAM_06605 [Blastocatellia bacterium]